MDVCDPGQDMKNIRKLVLVHTGKKIKLSRDEVCDIFRSAKLGKLPLPPLGITRDKRYLMDAKSQMTQSDYEVLFSSSSVSTEIKRLARKVGLINTDKSISELKTAIGRRLRGMKVREPVMLTGGARTIKPISSTYNNVKNNGENTTNRNVNGNAKNINVNGNAKNININGNAKNINVNGNTKNRNVNGNAKNINVNGNMKNRNVSVDTPSITTIKTEPSVNIPNNTNRYRKEASNALVRRRRESALKLIQGATTTNVSKNVTPKPSIFKWLFNGSKNKNKVTLSGGDKNSNDKFKQLQSNLEKKQRELEQQQGNQAKKIINAEKAANIAKAAAVSNATNESKRVAEEAQKKLEDAQTLAKEIANKMTTVKSNAEANKAAALKQVEENKNAALKQVEENKNAALKRAEENKNVALKEANAVKNKAIEEVKLAEKEAAQAATAEERAEAAEKLNKAQKSVTQAELNKTTALEKANSNMQNAKNLANKKIELSRLAANAGVNISNKINAINANTNINALRVEIQNKKSAANTNLKNKRQTQLSNLVNSSNALNNQDKVKYLNSFEKGTNFNTLMNTVRSNIKNKSNTNLKIKRQTQLSNLVNSSNALNNQDKVKYLNNFEKGANFNTLMNTVRSNIKNKSNTNLKIKRQTQLSNLVNSSNALNNQDKVKYLNNFEKGANFNAIMNNIRKNIKNKSNTNLKNKQQSHLSNLLNSSNALNNQMKVKYLNSFEKGANFNAIMNNIRKNIKSNSNAKLVNAQQKAAKANILRASLNAAKVNLEAEKAASQTKINEAIEAAKVAERAAANANSANEREKAAKNLQNAQNKLSNVQSRANQAESNLKQAANNAQSKRVIMMEKLINNSSHLTNTNKIAYTRRFSEGEKIKDLAEEIRAKMAANQQKALNNAKAAANVNKQKALNNAKIAANAKKAANNAEAARKAQEEANAKKAANNAEAARKAQEEANAKKAANNAEAARVAQEEANAKKAANNAEAARKAKKNKNSNELSVLLNSSNLLNNQDKVKYLNSFEKGTNFNTLMNTVRSNIKNKTNKRNANAKKAANNAEAARKAQEEANAKKAANNAEAARKAQEEANAKKAANNAEAARKAQEEANAKKAANNAEAARKAQEEANAKKAANNAEAARKAQEEANAKKAANNAEAAREAQEEANAKKAANNAEAARKAKKNKNSNELSVLLNSSNVLNNKAKVKYLNSFEKGANFNTLMNTVKADIKAKTNKRNANTEAANEAGATAAMEKLNKNAKLQGNKNRKMLLKLFETTKTNKKEANEYINAFEKGRRTLKEIKEDIVMKAKRNAFGRKLESTPNAVVNNNAEMKATAVFNNLNVGPKRNALMGRAKKEVAQIGGRIGKWGNAIKGVKTLNNVANLEKKLNKKSELRNEIKISKLGPINKTGHRVKIMQLENNVGARRRIFEQQLTNIAQKAEKKELSTYISGLNIFKANKNVYIKQIGLPNANLNMIRASANRQVSNKSYNNAKAMGGTMRTNPLSENNNGEISAAALAPVKNKVPLRLGGRAAEPRPPDAPAPTTPAPRSFKGVVKNMREKKVMNGVRVAAKIAKNQKEISEATGAQRIKLAREQRAATNRNKGVNTTTAASLLTTSSSPKSRQQRRMNEAVAKKVSKQANTKKRLNNQATRAKALKVLKARKKR